MTNTIAQNKKTELGDKPINRMGFGAMQLAGQGYSVRPRTLTRLVPC